MFRHTTDISNRVETMSVCKTLLRQLLSQVSVCSAPSSSRIHSTSLLHCFVQVHTIAGTPATITCGLSASSRIRHLSARAAYDTTLFTHQQSPNEMKDSHTQQNKIWQAYVRFLEGSKRQMACARGPNETAGKKVPSTALAREIAAFCWSSGFSL